ncbi:cell wall-associated hydrolase [Lactobacillus kefiranofaciens subsp. kefiranofaciens DSM 5016 = JCM 6985]|nr:cell wall-associated hydrolase [Lactobacillus kefiranofaciens subsp. kefirgranum DSM 10550 = JCM 8572]KRM20784.1 cell wall-associated hydrolase [Lactobacillus kefiranofaciens subsp. kefiranofaciens DSM 5016 = JCM 6985]
MKLNELKKYILRRQLVLSFKRTLVKYTAALSIFFTGLATVNVPAATTTVHADEISVNSSASTADLETSNPAAGTVKTATSSVTKKRNAVVKLAKKQIGKPYVWGATGPSAFDCSGLTSYVFKNAINKTLPRTTYSQINLGKSVAVSTKKLKKGDLLFWGNYHVGIYIGGGKFVHAPAPGQNVKTQTLASFYPSAAKRVID